MMSWATFLAAVLSSANAACEFSYYGGEANCWPDSIFPSSHILPAVVSGLPTSSFSVEVCADACSHLSSSYVVLAVEGGTSATCTCGVTPNLPANKGIGCDIPCNGNPTQICGGINLNATVYNFKCGDNIAAPSTKSDAGKSGLGLCDIIGVIFLIALAVAAVGYLTLFLVLTFALKKEGDERTPGLQPTLALFQDAAGFIRSGGRGHSDYATSV